VPLNARKPLCGFLRTSVLFAPICLFSILPVAGSENLFLQSIVPSLLLCLETRVKWV
jgi:hypothetical protein